MVRNWFSFIAQNVLIIQCPKSVVLPQGSNFIFSLQNKNSIFFLLHKSKNKIVLGQYFTHHPLKDNILIKPNKTMYIIIYAVLFNNINIKKYYTALIIVI